MPSVASVLSRQQATALKKNVEHETPPEKRDLSDLYREAQGS
jgi:hypothetical protein